MASGKPATCELEIRVRYAETDPMGYLHHSRYFEYFEMGRTELLRLAGFRYRDLEARGVLFAVAKLECRFRAPAHYDDLLILTTRIDRMTRARIDHSYELRRGGTLLCEARSTLACIDRTGRLIPIPDELFDQSRAADPAGRL
jgi:acyl-CoA thioester hydrolase